MKTNDEHVKAKFMVRKGGRLRESGVFVNDDLTKAEQVTRRQMVPVFREVRAAGVRCHLDRASLIVGDRRYFDPDIARAEALSTLHKSGTPAKGQEKTYASAVAKAHSQ